MNVKYEVLTTVSLQHEFYTDKNCPDFNIMPSPGTIDTLKNLDAVCKIVNGKLVILVRVDENGRAFRTMPDAGSLVFYLVANNPVFFNYTNITGQYAAGKRYYFTNRADIAHSGTTVKYLSADIEDYAANKPYAIGDLMIYSGQCYEAIQTQDGISNPVTPLPAAWKQVAGSHYVNNNDLLEFTNTGTYRFIAAAPATSFTIKIFRYTGTGSSVQVGDDVVQTYPSAVSEVPVKLENFPAGYYTIQVNSESKNIFLDGDAVQAKAFGVIELYGINDGSSYALFESNGVLDQPAFVIPFLNRSVYWIYYTSMSVDSLTDETGTYEFAGAEDEVTNTKYFTSNTLIPLTQKSLPDLTLQIPPEGDITNIPAPRTDRLSRYTTGGYAYYSVEQYLAY